MIKRLHISDLDFESRRRGWLTPVLHNPHLVLTLHKRTLGGAGSDSASRKLVIAGIVSGVISILILLGLVVYLVGRSRRQRHHPRPRQSRTSVPATSQIRNGYSRARVASGVTEGTRSKSAGTAAADETKQGYFKSWSKSKKSAYLSVPTGLDGSRHQIVLESSDAVYRYDPEAAVGYPKHKRPKSTPSALAMLAPSPKVHLPPRPPFTEITNAPRPAARAPPDHPRTPNRAIRPRAELRMGQASLHARIHSLGRTKGALGSAGLGSFVPPPPPSWASFWPTESGFTGYGGEPSIRDEEFGDGSEEEWVSNAGHVKEKLRERDQAEEAEEKDRKGQGVGIVLETEAPVRTDSSIDDEGGQYAIDTRPVEQIHGQFRLTPRELQGDGRTSLEVDPVVEGGSFATGASPLPSARLETRSPHLDLGDSGESDVDELSRLTDRPTELRRGATGRFTIAFGESSSSGSPSCKGPGSKSDHATHSNSDPTRSSGLGGHSNRTRTDHSGSRSPSRPTPGHSRDPSGAVVTRSNTGVTRSSTRLTRSSTMRTDHTDSSGGSSGQVLSALTGRIATPLLRSVDSLRRVIGVYTESPEMEYGSPVTTGSSAELAYPLPPPYSTPVRRLPPIPSASAVPPVPLIPQRFLSSPQGHTLAGLGHTSTHTSLEHGVQRSMSLPSPDSRALPSRPDGLPHAAVLRSTSMRVTRAIRPLPVPPLPIPAQRDNPTACMPK